MGQTTLRSDLKWMDKPRLRQSVLKTPTDNGHFLFGYNIFPGCMQ